MTTLATYTLEQSWAIMLSVAIPATLIPITLALVRIHNNRSDR